MRENILHTYLSLAGAQPHTQVWQLPEYTMCTGPAELSFCNFAAGFSLSSDRHLALSTLQELKQRVVDNRRFWVFHLSGDQPSNLPTLLLEAGFVPKHGLIEMAHGPSPTAPGLQLSHWVEPEDRNRVAEFMANVFFWRMGREYRSQVARATVGSGLDLYSFEEDGEVVGALMLSLSGRSVGLYNLCVEDDRRNRGLGSAMVRFVQGLCYERGLPLLLQCDATLQPWYASLGFEKVGRLTAYAVQAS